MKEKILELGRLVTDKEKILFCQKYNNDFMLYLDNDSTSIHIKIDYDNWDEEKIEEYESYYDLLDYEDFSLEKDIGNRQGVVFLLEMLDIDYAFA